MCTHAHTCTLSPATLLRICYLPLHPCHLLHGTLKPAARIAGRTAPHVHSVAVATNRHRQPPPFPCARDCYSSDVRPAVSGTQQTGADAGRAAQGAGVIAPTQHVATHHEFPAAIQASHPPLSAGCGCAGAADDDRVLRVASCARGCCWCSIVMLSTALLPALWMNAAAACPPSFS